jgi:hypothetical protein
MGIGTKFARAASLVSLLGTLGCGGGSVSVVLGDTTPHYNAVVDAGSSGSRIYLYSVTPDDRFVQVRLMFTNMDVPHGLSWYDGTQGADSAPANAGASGIAPLLFKLKTYLSANGIKPESVPVNVLATAGMRLVDADTADAIYQSVKSSITAQGLSYRKVGTITGQSEGLYSWADVNYLQGHFHKGTPTQGIVEVGGASSQVAFVSYANADSHVVPVTVNGVSYPVFSVSYLGLGQNQARLSMVSDARSGGTVANVCYPNHTGTSPAVYDAAVGGLSISATASNYSSTCYSVYENVVVSVSANASNNYPVAHLTQQAGYATTHFLGISSLYFALQEWGAIGNANPQQSLQEALQRNCGGTNAWPKVLSMYNNDASSIAQNGCANGTFISAYVYGANALRIPPDKLTPVKTINGTDPTWTRGFVVLSGS